MFFFICILSYLPGLLSFLSRFFFSPRASSENFNLFCISHYLLSYLFIFSPTTQRKIIDFLDLSLSLTLSYLYLFHTTFILTPILLHYSIFLSYLLSDYIRSYFLPVIPYPILSSPPSLSSPSFNANLPYLIWRFPSLPQIPSIGNIHLPSLLSIASYMGVRAGERLSSLSLIFVIFFFLSLFFLALKELLLSFFPYHCYLWYFC